MSRVTRSVPRWRLRLPEDPGWAALRRAARATVVMPPAFAIALLVVRDGQFSTFLAFGTFSLLVMADFGGPRRPRAIAYASTTAGGAVLVVIGTLASATPWAAAAVTLVIAFSLRFAGLFGGYVAAAQIALLLSYVLSVAVPAPPSAIVPRVLGWVIAGVLATLAGVLLWPRFEHVRLTQRAAAACRALAQLTEASRQRQPSVEASSRRTTAISAVGAARNEYRVAPQRPTWPARQDRALAELLPELASILELAIHPFPRASEAPRLPPTHPCLQEGDRLATAVAETLNGSAHVLTGGAPPDPSRLEAARLAHRRALETWAGEALRSGATPQDVLDGLAVDDTLNVVSYLTLALAQNALIVAGGEPPPEAPLPVGVPRLSGLKGVLDRIGDTLRAHLEPRSIVLHDSIRAAVGIALAVLISRLLRLDHAFWVVLGTLSALRSNALATGRTTIDVLIGTLVGFAIGSALALVAGINAAVAWAILPLAAFTAAYASTAGGFVVGQAAFTVFVIAIFNLISPAGWRVGLVRIEDVAIGVGISMVTALLLWPRGARRDLGRAVAGLYRSVADFLAISLSTMLGQGSVGSAMRARTAAVRARDRAGEALCQFLSERSARVLDPECAAFLVASGKHAVMFGDLIDVGPRTGFQAGPTVDGIDALYTQRDVLATGLKQLATVLDGHASPDAAATVPRVSDDVLNDVAVRTLQQWGAQPSVERAAVAAVSAVEWMQLLDRLVGRLQEPVATAASAARVPWWR